MPEVSPRVCLCGCGTSLEGRRAGTFYVDGAHRQRAHRKRIRDLAGELGVPASLSLETLEATRTLRLRNGDAQVSSPRARRRPREGVTLYLPTLELAEALEAILGEELSTSRRLAEIVRRGIERRRARTSE